MWIGLLWIVGCYGVSIVLLHLIYGIRYRKRNEASRVLLITRNNQLQIEWYIRSLFFFSRIKGRDIAATILDDGSTDDTMKIIERLSQRHTLDVEVYPQGRSLEELLEEHENEDLLVVNLSNRDDLVEIPLFYQ
jgi:hypothetical protein